MDTQSLVEYFTKDVDSYDFAETVGMEIETQFLQCSEDTHYIPYIPIMLETSQAIFRTLAEKHGFAVHAAKGALITELLSPHGDKVCYELGRHNIEVSTVPLTKEKQKNLLRYVYFELLSPLYEAASTNGAFPAYVPVLDEYEGFLLDSLESALYPSEDLLVIPDERDASWLTLDGREALNLLARTSSVQFTIDVPLRDAIPCLNALGRRILQFLADYPQDYVWRKYIKTSKAGYDELRYGGPLLFNDLAEYCAKLAAHPVVMGEKLVPFAEAEAVDIPLFLRSVWWYFRLKRYGKKLCIEVRPLARRNDDMFELQLSNTLWRCEKAL